MGRPNAGSILVRPYALPLRIPYRWSKGVHHQRAGLLIRIEIDGAIGWGEAALAPHIAVDWDKWAFLCQMFVHDLDPRSDDFLMRLEEREVTPRLRCGLSTAWLSARAAREGVSLARYLAGSGRSVAAAVPVNGLVTDRSPEDCVSTTADAVAQGQRTVKVKCTADRELDLARIRAIREAFPDVRIRLDPNESWSRDWLLEHLEAMARFEIEYVEEPLARGTDISVYAEVRRRSPIPIALDDSVRTPVHAQRIIERGAADVLILKAQRLGGPDCVLRVVDAAAAVGLRCVVTASLETAIGLHAALHCAALLPQPIDPCGLGTARFFVSDVAAPPVISDGFMIVPPSRGLGVQPHLDLGDAGPGDR